MNLKAQMIVNFMNANLHRKLSLDEMARSITISPSHLCRLFRSEAGMPPGQYLQILRMQQAANLLISTLMSIKQVMIEVGYRDKALFARHFKKMHGCTPSEYRIKYGGLIRIGDD